MSEQKIKPCRFCGGSGRMPLHFPYYVQCALCLYRAPNRTMIQDAIAAWNEINTVQEQRDEGVVAWMEPDWREQVEAGKLMRVTAKPPRDGDPYPCRVRIIPEPEPVPRYEAMRWGGGAKVVDAASGWARAYFDGSHPYPWAAAHAEAERLNQREHEQRGGE